MSERILITGDRDWDDYRYILKTLRCWKTYAQIDCLIEGEARGADKMSRQAAEELGIPVLESAPGVIGFPADWEKYRKAAGPIRNRQMMKEGRPTLCLAFHRDLKSSRGTLDMVKVALPILGQKVHLYPDDGYLAVLREELGLNQLSLI